MSVIKLPLYAYLAAERAKGVIDFHIRVSPPRYPGDSEVRFYIHPAHVSGETADYSVSENPERPDTDFIYNLMEIAEPDVQAFRDMLRSRRLETLGWKLLRWKNRQGEDCSGWRSPDGKQCAEPPEGQT